MLPQESSLERPSNTLVDESEEQFLEQQLLEDDYTDMVMLLQQAQQCQNKNKTQPLQTKLQLDDVDYVQNVQMNDRSNKP